MTSLTHSEVVNQLIVSGEKVPKNHITVREECERKESLRRLDETVVFIHEGRLHLVVQKGYVAGAV